MEATNQPTPVILSDEALAKIEAQIGSGALLLPLRVEGWHKSLTDGGWFVRHATGRTLATVEFVPAEIETGRPALNGNAPARAVAELLNAIPALCQTVRALRARIRELEDLAYIGEHHHPDLTWKSRALEHNTENTALREQLAHATEYGEKLARNYSSLEDWILRIRIKLGLQAKDADIEGAVETLQSKLAQVEKGRDKWRSKYERIDIND